MARAPAKTPAKETGKQVMSWQDAAKQSAEQQREMEKKTGGGRFFSMRAGQLKFDDVPLPGNMMACVILDSIFETLYYRDGFDPDNPQTPTAFALGRDQKELTWNEEYSDPEFAGQLCKDSEVCEWGSAETGRGKAAKETRRLAIIPAGIYKSLGKGKGFDLEMFSEEEDFAKSDIAYMKLPVMSVKGFSGFVREVADQLGKPTWGVFVNISVEPDDKSQFRVDFELLEEIPEGLMETIYKRHLEAAEAIDFPYVPRDDDDGDDKPAAKGKAPAKANNAAKKLAGKAPARGRQSAKK